MKWSEWPSAYKRARETAKKHHWAFCLGYGFANSMLYVDDAIERFWAGAKKAESIWDKRRKDRSANSSQPTGP
jgi:hypothetical protein